MAGATRITDGSQIGPNKFKPAQCAGITLTNLVVVSGASGSGPNSQRNLVIGNGSQSQTLAGGSQSDCIVAGGASTGITNLLVGNGGADVFVGGRHATNSYFGGLGPDTCYYRPSDAVPSAAQCETRILLP